MKGLILSFLLLTSQWSFSQKADSTKQEIMKSTQLEAVIVTATRTHKELKDIPIPIATISAHEIENRGIVRLQEILGEQTGLAIINDHGMGIQMQGLNPEYTMILIDGEPIIGRTSGTLELSRITTNNVEKIEIIKGPSSSLYGSEAMAGVINIITSSPQAGLSTSLSTRYGTNNSSDVSINGAYKNKCWSVDAFVNRNSSDGYSLLPQSGTSTVSPFDNYTFHAKTSFHIDDRTKLKLSGRYFINHQLDRFKIEERLVKGDGNVYETAFAPTINRQFNSRLFSSLRFYHSIYKTDSQLDYQDNKDPYDQTFFKQIFNKMETQHDYTFSNTFKLTAGAGGQFESVEATRYDQQHSFYSGFAYMQVDWSPTERINVLAGSRYDAHSEYKHQFSPKLALSYQFSKKLTVLGSVGSGYKAPDFRQLYLNFSNAVVGYSVLGYAEAYSHLMALQEAGQIQSILVDPSNLLLLNAESSTAYNIGYRYNPIDRLKWTVNIFRNDVKNLIETVPIAIKTNGQSVYTYSNLNRIFTQGVETELSFQFNPYIQLAGGFQFMQAYDKDVLDKIDRGEIFGRNPKNNETIQLKRNDYGGLVNRSRYMGNIRISYQQKGYMASLRAIYRGKYGLGDSNGNGIVDQDNEYVSGYCLFNASIAKQLINNQFKLQLTVNNLLNYTDPNFISNLSGRLIYVGINYNLSSIKSSL